MKLFTKWKWNFDEEIPFDKVYQKLYELEEKYSALLLDVKRLEEENIETTNSLYEIANSIEAVDARIDILTAENFIKTNKNV